MYWKSIGIQTTYIPSDPLFRMELQNLSRDFTGTGLIDCVPGCRLER